MALCGVLLLILFFVADIASLWDRFYLDILPYVGNYAGIFSSLTSFYIWGISAALIITAAVGITLNIFGRRSIHRFANPCIKAWSMEK